MRRIVLALVGALVTFTFATPSHATLNACAAGKKKCVSKKTAGLLKCHQLAEKKGLDPVSDPKVLDCLQKVVIKFEGGADPSKGCFTKLEAKFPGGCLTTADTAALENTVDRFVAAVVGALDPNYPAPVTNACSVGKKKCVSKKATALLACHSKNEKPPAGLAPAKFAACLQKARDQFDGGADPMKGCFAKLEAKFPDCLTTLDTAGLEATVDGFVNDVVCQLDAGSGTCPLATPTATATRTPTPTPTSTPCTGFLAGPTCGNPTSAGTLVPGSISSASGNLPAGGQGWYTVTFLAGGSLPTIELIGNPGNAYSFDVLSSCSTPVVCTNSVLCFPGVGTFQVGVKAAVGICANYTLRFSNQ